jgi:exopolysaccharide production protein ExoQ
VLLGSLLFGWFYPALAIHKESSYELVNAWHGLANHKNTLGALACMGLIFWFHAWLADEVRWWKALLGALVAGACLFLSRSSTSLVTAVFALCFLALMQRGPHFLRPYIPYLVALFVTALLVYSLAILRRVPGLEILLKPIVMLTGKDPSFTGRSEIWALIMEHFRYDRFLGTGLGAYWIGAVPWSPSYDFIARMNFYPGSAHNGYLELAKDLGIVGLLCLVGYLVHYVWQAIQLLRVRAAQASLLLALFLQQALTNLSESHWFYVQSVGFVIVTLATVALGRALLEMRFRQFFGEPQAYWQQALPRHPMLAAPAPGNALAAMPAPRGA